METVHSGVTGKPRKRRRDRWPFALHAGPALGALGILMLALFGAYGIQWAESQADAQAERITAEKRARDVAALISSSMTVRLNLTSSLSAFVTTHRIFSAEEFDHFASLLKRDLKGVMSLQLAPGGVVTYLTDLERNRKALGHDLLADPKRRSIAEKSNRERSYIIAGPIELIQGGAGYHRQAPHVLPRPQQ